MSSTTLRWWFCPVVYSLFVVALIVCEGLVLGAVLCVLSSVAIISLLNRELVALLCCVLNVTSLLSFFDPSSRRHGLVCSL